MTPPPKGTPPAPPPSTPPPEEEDRASPSSPKGPPVTPKVPETPPAEKSAATPRPPFEWPTWTPWAAYCLSGLVVGILVMLALRPAPSTYIIAPSYESPFPSMSRRLDDQDRAINDLRRKP